MAIAMQRCQSEAAAADVQPFPTMRATHSCYPGVGEKVVATRSYNRGAEVEITAMRSYNRGTDFEVSDSRSLKPLCAKTKMCSFFRQGTCTRGSACSYAHSMSELRSMPDLTRTRMCAKMFMEGRCERGNDCKFAHSSREVRSLQLSETQTDGDEFAAPLVVPTGSHRRAQLRLQDFFTPQMAATPSFGDVAAPCGVSGQALLPPPQQHNSPAGLPLEGTMGPMLSPPGVLPTCHAGRVPCPSAMAPQFSSGNLPSIPAVASQYSVGHLPSDASQVTAMQVCVVPMMPVASMPMQVCYSMPAPTVAPEHTANSFAEETDMQRRHSCTTAAELAHFKDHVITRGARSRTTYADASTALDSMSENSSDDIDVVEVEAFDVVDVVSCRPRFQTEDVSATIGRRTAFPRKVEMNVFVKNTFLEAEDDDETAEAPHAQRRARSADARLQR